ncbi:MAG: GNAT family N-acetyltransferase [Polyangiaceae bacterium]|nr:GNAT family N-acetyltransferase [Polyangiaceae bacterium]
MSQRGSDEIIESNDQFAGMWTEFARRFPTGKIEQLPGLHVMLSGTPMSFINVISLSSPVRDRDDLAGRARMAVDRAKQSGVPWLFSACDAWLGDPEIARATLAELGLAHALGTVGMVTDEIAPPRRPLPEGLEMRRVSDEATRNALADLNTISYGIPIEAGRQGPARDCFWDESFFGYVAYLDGEPVSSTMTAPVDGRLYVAWVATHPRHRRKGYADAVMRRSLEEARAATGLRRTVLHATDAGRPVYEAMGYRPVVGFTWYAPAE